MWRIYDELIEEVPKDLRVKECIIGLHWTLIRSDATIGMALTPFERGNAHGAKGSATSGISKPLIGMPVRELAQFSKSWNPFEAALGLAAINSYFNAPSKIESLLGQSILSQQQVSAFMHYADAVRGKKVAVIGRFPDLDEFDKLCRLTVLERNPGHRDLPDPACEYVLPEQDVVFITATTIINKTLPRLLELSRNAFTFLVGPSAPFAPLLANHGIDAVAGTVVFEPDRLKQAVLEGATWGIFSNGALMVKKEFKDFAL